MTEPMNTMTEDVDGLIERQRADDDCTICAIAMATGLSYERVMEAAVAMDAGGYRYAGKPGTMSPKGLLMALGFEATRVGLAAIPPGHAKSLLWGRRAILSIPSLNGFPGHHDVYWDGRAIRDPSQKLTYPPNAAWSFQPIWAVLLDAASALKSLKQELDAALSGERGMKELLHKVEGERDEARILVIQYAREAGEATGRLEMSEAAGIVDGWRQRAEKAERELAEVKEAEPDGPGAFEGDIFFGDPRNSTRGTHRWQHGCWWDTNGREVKPRVIQGPIPKPEEGGDASDLEPCPFCGGRADIGICPETENSPRGYFCKCQSCLAETGMSSNRAVIVAQWNTRSEARAEAEERVKGLRDALERLVKPSPGVKMLPPWAVGIARAALQQHSDGGER